jgi:hypothetical protein
MHAYRHSLSHLATRAACTLAWLSYLLLGICQAAAIYQYPGDPSAYGTLDQHEVCPAVLACGPTAAANSLAFLEGQGLAPGTLVPRTAGNDFPTDLGLTAENLANNYMQTQADGTRVPAFINGMYKYLGDRLAGNTRYLMQAQWGAAWDPTVWGPKPGFVSDAQPPTWQFIYARLKEGWNVELALDGKDAQGFRVGHYLTLTGFYFADFDFDDLIDQGQDIAFIDYIDPWTGAAGRANLWDRQGTPNILGTDYVGAAHVKNGVAYPALALTDVRIIGAIAERIPEPASWLLALAALAGVMVARRHKTAAPIA